MQTPTFSQPSSLFFAWLVFFCTSLHAAILPETPPTDWKVAARITLPQKLQIQGYQVGGLSGIYYDPATQILWSVSDARRWPQSKVFRFKLKIVDGSLQIEPLDVLSLHRGGKMSEALDAEGIALLSAEQLFISHEGSATGLFAAGVSAFNPQTGQVLFALPIPEYFFPTKENPRQGIQRNRGFESLCLSRPNPLYLYMANESPLMQDLLNPNNANAGPIRILRYDLNNLKLHPTQRAYVAETDAIFGSVPDILGYSKSKLLILERQILWPIEPRKRRIRIYWVDFEQSDATDVSSLPSLQGKNYTPLSKNLVFDSQSSGMSDVENFEGITWGPEWNGKPTLLLVSDDNFSKSQRTEFLLLLPKN